MENQERGEREEKSLTEDLITDIISRVPTKHLTRLTCVSKSWRSLIRTDPYFFRLQRTASLHRLHGQIRMHILEGFTSEDLGAYAAVGAREILSTYEHLNVFPDWFRQSTERALHTGYRVLAHRLERSSATLQPVRNPRRVFTIKDLQCDGLQDLARLAMDRYNDTRKEKWVFEEVIHYAHSNCGTRYFLYFGARKISSKVLRLFHAELYCPPDESESEEVESVNLLRKTRKRKKLVQIGSLGDKGKQLDGCIFVRKTRKTTYMKQGGSCDIISYRNTEEDKIRYCNEKDKQVDESSMGID